MDFGYAITYIFEDRKWVSKITILALIMFFSSIPIFGLLATAIGLGFMMQVTDNVRNGLPRPLPEWNDYGVKFTLGGQVLAVIIVYNLPIILLSGCLLVSLSGVGATVVSLVLCCVVPFMLIYMAITWSMLAVGVAEFIETGEVGTLYRFTHLFDVLRHNLNLTVGWALYATLWNVITLAVLFVPCAGWIAFLVFQLPVHGHLLGQYAQKLGVKNKPIPRHV